MALPPSTPPWVPLRVHGHHSLLTGVDSPAALLARAEELGLAALALTDVDSIAGVVDFLSAARSSSVRPIVGAELSEPDGRDGRLIALVKDEQGWRNLCKLISARKLGDDPGAGEAQLEGPERFDLAEAAIRFQAGLVLLVDHPRLAYALEGRVARDELFVALPASSLAHPCASTRAAPRAGRPSEAHASPASQQLEPNKTPPPARTASAADLLGTAESLRLECVAAPDVYWACPGGARAHRVRAAVKHNALLDDLPEGALAEEPAHLLPPPDVRTLYADHPRALVATRVIAERCDYVPPLGGVLLPEVQLEGCETPYSRLVELSFAGAHARYQPLRPEVVRRLDHELTSIHELGFAAYFLLVHRIATFAWSRSIPCVGRGSAADSLVAYCLGLTDADPLRYRLPFERFLNPTRADRPDIDLDFCWRRRDEVLEAVYSTFGAERTAMISTLCSFGLRAAFREAALVHGVPPAEVNRWSRRLPWMPFDDEGAEHDGGEPEQLRHGEGSEHDEEAELEGAPYEERASRSRIDASGKLDGSGLTERALRAVPECRGFPFEDPRMRAVLEAADGLHDTPRHFGLHPGGVVVAPGPISDFVACQRAAKGPVVTQLDKDGVEAIGLVKMDLLGNRALTVLDDCAKLLRARGIDPELEAVPEDDLRTAELLRTGSTLGCFQVESPGMRHLLQQSGAQRMDDVIQAVALIRPGPAGSGMKDAYVRRSRGLEEPTPPHPRLTELLWDTHGVMLYQEDVMQAASLVAGMDLSEADQLRRALAKHCEEDILRLRQRFFEGARSEGIEPAQAAAVWELVHNFASFGFCKAHAVTYGRIAYRAVYLKAHWPAAFLVAFLMSRTGYYEQRVYVEEARRLGVPILGPDVNKSEESFSLEAAPSSPGSDESAPPGADSGALRVGLGQLKGLSQKTLARLLESREQAGPFLSLPDFLGRVAPRRAEAEGLIQCGALDGFDRTRPELLWRLHLLLEPQRRIPRDAHGLLDPLALAACRETPETRTRDAVREARARTGGWGVGSLALGGAELAPGETPALFPAPEVPAVALPRLPDLDAYARGRLEFELLGLSLRVHPTRLFAARTQPPENARRGAPLTPCARVRQLAGGRVTVHGWLAATRRVHTKDGKWMRFLTLEDESGVAEGVLFPPSYERWGHVLAHRGPFYVTGVVQDQLGACTIDVQRIDRAWHRRPSLVL